MNSRHVLGSLVSGMLLAIAAAASASAQGSFDIPAGAHFNPEKLERVFDAFYTTKTSGMGMGLSICRSIIDAHGGRLWAGVNEPRGAAFQFTLPASKKKGNHGSSSGSSE